MNRIPDDDPDHTAWLDQRPAWKAPLVHLDEDRVLVLEWSLYQGQIHHRDITLDAARCIRLPSPS